MPLKVINFGCRLNIHESQIIREEAEKAGLEKTNQDSIIFNTCAVTSEAVRQARQSIRKARRENPSARIIVTGCAAQIEPHNFSAMKEIDLVLGNNEKLYAQSYAPLSESFGIQETEKIKVNDIMSVRETAAHMISSINDRVRSFIQIQNGCDHRCTFCIIPYARGNSRSVPMGVLTEQIKKLTEKGCIEVVLTGVDLTAYGLDLPGSPSLGRLVKTLLKEVPEIQRLRLSSIDCIEADKELEEALETEKRLMPHLHLSLQAGDNLILKRMKRRHSRDDAIRFCEALRKIRPDIVFGADIIAGFPTETEEMFQNTLHLIDECKLVYLHVFPFSPRPGTPAARMPQSSRESIKEKASRLRHSAEKAYLEHFSRKKETLQSILVEKNGTGRTEDFTPCTLDKGQPGEMITARITGHNNKHLFGLVLPENKVGS